jgi:glutathione S-transferase
MTQNYELYCFGESGNAYKVALYLALAGLPWTPRFVDFFNGETRTPAYRETVNEMGEAPVLIDGDRKLTQSGAILLHLAEKHGAFAPTSKDERDEVLRWMFFDNHKFTSYLATLRFMISITKTGETPVTEFLRGRVVGNLKIVDKHLARQNFIVADRLTIADLSMCAYLFYGEEIPVPLSDYPHIVAWLDRIRAMPGWKGPYDLMPGRKT